MAYIRSERASEATPDTKSAAPAVFGRPADTADELGFLYYLAPVTAVAEASSEADAG